MSYIKLPVRRSEKQFKGLSVGEQYIGVPMEMAKAFKAEGWEFVSIEYSVEDKAIKLTKEKTEGEYNHKIHWGSIRTKLSRLMPSGRYLLQTETATEKIYLQK